MAQIGPKIKSAQNLSISDIFDYSHISVSVLMTKIIVIKYLITCLAQIGPKIKSGQNLLKLSTFKISNMSIWILTSKIIFMKYLLPARPNLVPKFKMLRVYWNLHIWYFEYPDLDFDVKSFFHSILTTSLAQIGPKIKSAQSLLKFGTFDISNILISILMSKIIFIKYLPLLRPKLVPKLKVLRIYWNSIFQIYQNYSKIKIACKFMFGISSNTILTKNSDKISLINYYMLCQNWSRSLNFNFGYKM